MDFNDRRPVLGPVDDDYSTPVTRDTLAEAHARVRAAVRYGRVDGIDRAIHTTAVQRHRARQDGRGDFESVGTYLEFITAAAEADPTIR